MKKEINGTYPSLRSRRTNSKGNTRGFQTILSNKKDRQKGKKLGGGKKYDTSTTPSAQHDRKDENNQKPHKNDDEINCKTK